MTAEEKRREEKRSKENSRTYQNNIYNMIEWIVQMFIGALIVIIIFDVIEKKSSKLIWGDVIVLCGMAVVISLSVWIGLLVGDTVVVLFS
jgi:F0F1-type ATP synthase assembly protein I